MAAYLTPYVIYRVSVTGCRSAPTSTSQIVFYGQHSLLFQRLRRASPVIDQFVRHFRKTASPGTHRSCDVLVVGAGTGGSAIANKFARTHAVTVIEPSDVSYPEIQRKICSELFLETVYRWQHVGVEVSKLKCFLLHFKAGQHTYVLLSCIHCFEFCMFLILMAILAMVHHQVTTLKSIIP